MFKIMQGLPKNVLGVEARGTITDDDYRTVLIPRANEMLEKFPSIKLLYVAGKDFKGYDARAVWDDALFGLRRRSRCSHVAVVTDTEWLRAATHFFSPFVSSSVKVFDLAGLAAAKIWIARSKPDTARKTDTIKNELILPALHTIRNAAIVAEKKLYKEAARHQKKARRRKI